MEDDQQLAGLCRIRLLNWQSVEREGQYLKCRGSAIIWKGASDPVVTLRLPKLNLKGVVQVGWRVP